MFIGDQSLCQNLGVLTLHVLPQLQSSLLYSEDRPCSRGRDMECRSGSLGPTPWAPGGEPRGLKSQLSARIGDSHSLTCALVCLLSWSLPLVLCYAHPSPGPCFHLTSPGSLTLTPAYGPVWSCRCPTHSWAILPMPSPPPPYLSLSSSLPLAVPDNIWDPLQKGFQPL